ncbi:hypothetical protein JW865_01510 [Candidatus Bathyarchaeota archaeon]|nr:hypothetical protein [Candidatus Bathyarchaeota archaeon]
MVTINIIESMIGIFALDDNNNVIHNELYINDKNYIADSIRKQSIGEVTKEISRMVDVLLKKGYKSFIMTNQFLAENLRDKFKINILVEEGSIPERILKENLPKIALDNNFIDNLDEFNNFNSEISTIISRNAIQTALSNKESLINQTVQILGEVETILNNLDGRVREWYSIHFPELNRIIKDHELFEKLVIEIGNKTNITETNLDILNFNKREKNKILKARDRSMGAIFEEKDIFEIQKLAKNTLQLHEFRSQLSDYISNLIKELSPNVSELVGSVLAAKLIEKAGSLKKLAMMPASRIQVIGAEKALYRAIKTKTKPPKHGLIFQHQYVNGAPKKLRGIRARHLAAKIAIAARADAFTGNYIAPELKKELDDAATWYDETK